MDSKHTMKYAMELEEWTENRQLNIQCNWKNGPCMDYGIYNGIERMDKVHTIEYTTELREWTNYVL